MICVVLCLSFSLQSAARLQGTIDEEKYAESEVCYRWDEEEGDVLGWITDGFVDVPTDPDEKEHQHFFVKSAARFYGGMTQKTLINGDQNTAGGLIGTSLAVSGPLDCKLRLESTRVLVREFVKRTAPVCLCHRCLCPVQLITCALVD